MLIQPFDSTSMIRLGLHLERKGDLEQAEKWLLRAAAVDHQFEPKSSLANFYFRRGRAAEFWRWVHQALEMDYADGRPLFALCWHMSSDAKTILQNCVPQDAKSSRKYLAYLVAEGKTQEALTVFERIRANLISEDTTMLLGFCDVLLAAQNGDAARAVWDQMTAQRLIPYLSSPATLVDGNFSVPIRKINRAFAWKLSEADGIDAITMDQPRALEISFSGREPESVEVLGQNFAVSPGQRYKFRYTFRTKGIELNSGLRWRIVTGSSAESPSLAADDWKTDEVTFQAAQGSIGYLVLLYERAQGTTRIRGTISVRDLEIEAVP